MGEVEVILRHGIGPVVDVLVTHSSRWEKVSIEAPLSITSRMDSVDGRLPESAPVALSEDYDRDTLCVNADYLGGADIEFRLQILNDPS